MNAIVQAPSLFRSSIPAAGRRRLRDARGLSVLVAAALDWAALAVAVLAFVAAGIVVWLG